MIRSWKRLGMVILALFTLWTVVACQTPSPMSSERSTDCAPIDHIAGTTCVPRFVERLVTLDTTMFENAIALGIKPIATVFSSLYPHLQSYTTGIETIGLQGEDPNLETILSTRPDLIIGLNHHQKIYSQASRIAPTVLVEFAHSGKWKEVFQAVSQTLGKADVGQRVMDDYYARLEEFKTKLGSQHLAVSVVRIYPASINLYLRDSFVGTVLQDAGLARPPAQDLSAEEAQQLANNPIQMQISRELLNQADGDAIFIWTAENETEGNQTAQRKLEELQADPLWKALNAVQKNRVYFVPSYWIGSGPLAANAIVDDLFKYLIEPQ